MQFQFPFFLSTCITVFPTLRSETCKTFCISVPIMANFIMVLDCIPIRPNDMQGNIIPPGRDDDRWGRIGLLVNSLSSSDNSKSENNGSLL